MFCFTDFTKLTRIGNSDNADNDICVITIGTSGDKRGYIKDVMGEITPNAIYSGLEIYEYTWDVVTGLFIISFGAAGDNEIDNLVQFFVKHPDRPDKNSAAWNSTDTQYDFTSLDLATFIGADVERSCFNIEPQYELLAWYDFDSISTGTGV